MHLGFYDKFRKSQNQSIQLCPKNLQFCSPFLQKVCSKYHCKLYYIILLFNVTYLPIFGCSRHRHSILMRQIRILMKQFRTRAGIEPRIIVLALAVRTIQIIVIIGKDIWCDHFDHFAVECWQQVMIGSEFQNSCSGYSPPRQAKLTGALLFSSSLACSPLCTRLGFTSFSRG